MNKNLWQNQDFKLNREYWSKKNPSESLKIRIENLLLINNILKKSEIFFFLEGQTLNHIYKKNSLDPKDHDDDIGVFYEDKEKILNLNNILKKNNFKIIRNNDQMISVCRMKRYIDICLFKKSILKIGYGKKRFPKKYYTKFNILNFENEEFNIPHDTDSLLDIRYEEK